MHRNLIEYFNYIFTLRHAYLNHGVGPKAITPVIKSLRPVATDKPLIRLGPEGDGGYLLPDDLENIEACFSPGVGLLSGFETDCANRGMEVFMADASVEGPANQHERFHFQKKFLAAYASEKTIILDDWVKSSGVGNSTDLMLQMDIEGGEYTVIPSISTELLGRFRIIAVEFHGLHRLWDKFFFRIASECFNKILGTHYCVHIHPNNVNGVFNSRGISLPRVAEFTFIRKDRVTVKGPVDTLPHPLDSKNTGKHDIMLPAYWYKNVD